MRLHLEKLQSVDFQNFSIRLFLYSATVIVFLMAYNTEYTPYESLSGLRFTVLIILSPIIFKYVVQLSTAPFYSYVDKRREANSTLNPKAKVSVIVPAWNEEVGILKTITSILESDHQNLELIVINDGSTDRTHQIVTNFIIEYRSKVDTNDESTAVIKYRRLKNGGKARALNYALRLSSGEFIITIDADSIMDKDAITKIIKRFTDDKVAAVAGNVIVGNRHKFIEMMQQLEYLFGFFFKRADSIYNSVYIVGGAAAAYRKEVLVELGGFDNELITEDIEMSTRILNCGYKTRYASDAIIYTEGPSDWKSLCNQRLRWKFGRLFTFIKHKNLFFSIHKQHHPYLTCLLLPVSVYVEITLLFEGFLLAVFFGYTIYAGEYMTLVFFILFISSLISVQILIDARSHFHCNLLMLAPVAWIIFYIIDLVEFQALCRSLNRYWKKENLQWQKWSRVGLENQP